MKSFNRVIQERFISSRQVKNELNDLLIPALREAEKLGDMPIMWRSQVFGRNRFSSGKDSVILLTTKVGSSILKPEEEFSQIHGFNNIEFAGDMAKDIMRNIGVKEPVFATQNREGTMMFGQSPMVVIPLGNFTVNWSPKINDIILKILNFSDDEFEGFGGDEDGFVKKISKSYKKNKNSVAGIHRNRELIIEIGSSKYLMFNPWTGENKSRKIIPKTYSHVALMLQDVIRDKVQGDIESKLAGEITKEEAKKLERKFKLDRVKSFHVSIEKDPNKMVQLSILTGEDFHKNLVEGYKIRILVKTNVGVVVKSFSENGVRAWDFKKNDYVDISKRVYKKKYRKVASELLKNLAAEGLL